MLKWTSKEYIYPPIHSGKRLVCNYFGETGGTTRFNAALADTEAAQPRFGVHLLPLSPPYLRCPEPGLDEIF